LFVDGRLVFKALPQAGNTELCWPLFPWRGHSARLELVDHSSKGWVAVSELSSERMAELEPFDDFEQGIYGPRWSERFDAAPLPAREVALRLGLEFVRGRFSALSLFQEGRRALVSVPFEVRRARLAALLFDCGASTRMELRVEGRCERSETGTKGRSVRPVDWDLTPFLGRTAVLAVLDDDADPEQGIGVDDIVLYDP
jgi:hypothetical protein